MQKLLPIFLAVCFFAIPFFWLRPGEIDLGGDDSRLFFYDPIHYLESSSIYHVIIQGKGVAESRNYDFFYVCLIAFLKFIFSSPTFLINTINGIKLSGAFFFIYLIIDELLRQMHQDIRKKYIVESAILAGLFYVVSLGSFHADFYWNRAVTSHNQVFLNPFVFYLLFKFFLTDKYRYLWITLLVSFIFAPNFSLTSVAPFFAFYPLAFVFLFVYVKMFGNKPIPWKGVIIGGVLFIGIQAFHLFAEAFSFLDKGSSTNTSVFSSVDQEGVGYFTAVRGQGKAILSLLLPSEKPYLQWPSVAAPFVIIVGLLLYKGRRKLFLLISFFFLITFFLVSANITNIGFESYRRLFYIPSFSMFRNFYGQWLFVFIFFYALLFGLSLNSVLLKLKHLYAKIFYFSVFVLLLIAGIPLFSGQLLNENIVRGSRNLSVVFEMDPKYEQALNFIRSLPDDGKILVLPLTNFNYQVIPGKNGGAYDGPATLRYLTTKYSFNGYRDFGYGNNVPYAEDIMKYSREQNYTRLLKIFTVLNIRYFFHVSDPKIYEEGFSSEPNAAGPFGYMQTSLPKTQTAYKDFIKHFPVHQIYKNGPYAMYEIDKSISNSTIFIPDGIYQSNKLSFDESNSHSVFIDKKICSMQELKKLCIAGYEKPDVNIRYKMVNPTLYELTLRVDKPVDEIPVVMQHTFHKGWKMVYNNQYIAEKTHVPVNGYANGWIINAKDLPAKRSYRFFIQLDQQKYLWYGLAITIFSLITVIALLILSLIRDNEKN